MSTGAPPNLALNASSCSRCAVTKQCPGLPKRRRREVKRPGRDGKRTGMPSQVARPRPTTRPTHCAGQKLILPASSRLLSDSRRCWISSLSPNVGSLYALVATADVRSGYVLHVEFETALLHHFFQRLSFLSNSCLAMLVSIFSSIFFSLMQASINHGGGKSTNS